MKRCFVCGLTKPLCEFGKDKSQKDGRARRCRDCFYDDDKRIRLNMKERQRAERLGQDKKHKTWLLPPRIKDE